MQLRIHHPDLEAFIERKVRAGQFESAEAVVEDALRRLMEAEREPLTAEDVGAIEAADAESERGESVEFADFASQMRAKFGLKHP